MPPPTTYLVESPAMTSMMDPRAVPARVPGGGLKAAGMAAPIIRIGEPTTFEGDGPYAGMDMGAEDAPALPGET